MRQPRGAESLMALRSRGKRPLAVVVTDNREIAQLAGHLLGYAALRAGAGEWDMRSVHRLPVVVWCWTDDILGLVESVAQCGPESISVVTKECEKLVFDAAERMLNG